mgnify:CR=1 FL=1
MSRLRDRATTLEIQINAELFDTPPSSLLRL